MPPFLAVFERAISNWINLHRKSLARLLSECDTVKGNRLQTRRGQRALRVASLRRQQQETGHMSAGYIQDVIDRW
jgi:hypothetical protein